MLPKTIQLAALLILLPLGACERETTPPPATGAAATLLGANAPTPATPPDDPAKIQSWITDLSSPDGQKRIAATKQLFQIDSAALKPLQIAGAHQVAPVPEGNTRRLDMVYSLIQGFPPNAPRALAGYAPSTFGLEMEKDCTLDEVTKLAEKHGLTLSGNFAADSLPSCYVQLKPGGNLADTLKEVLSNEPRVVSVKLNYFDK